ncbi:1,4-alpha-glucan branching protein GlgB [Macrococcus sp. DPC7161]|uniref:1,4-alpha-glucan branching protein GlgB n=1 Tax=Macrococcus sp. DPC7161 TaxID=2507060 RepID=UPI00100B7CC7|nr:1,4-alpha-glucan branching protein GlgB [Macrococcus sp. DPC7161]RXK18914.1 1,4-alpha-glucan branching protein GlgB [Macrococcus sp. DPC7161]
MVSELDQYLFHQGTHTKSYQFMGSHYDHDTKLTTFRVHAPNASIVSVACDQNDWTGKGFELERISEEGLFEGSFQVGIGTIYKYCIHANGQQFLKSDPFAKFAQKRPLNASIVYESTYQWADEKWQTKKKNKLPYDAPMNIYELHLGTFKKHEIDEQLKTQLTIDEYTDLTHLSYREMAEVIIPYVKEMKYTHIELLPVTEHPFDLSWGYQVTGFFAPTSRFGTPDDFKYFIDQCHQNNIGVILDWVPAHFNRDDHGLRLFDGSPLFEPSDARLADKRGWGTLSFDFSKPEVNSFLISSAMYFVEEFHIDGIRVDAVHSMIDLNFENHVAHEKIYNPDGTEDNRPAILFLQNLSKVLFENRNEFLLIAEDSSDRPMITAPVEKGGLGFNFKWDLGFMHDTLDYMEGNRRDLHHKLTFPMMYRYNENYILPYSHDEVVHGKLSMLDKMPGDQWRKFAQYRLLYGHQMTFPGKKLNFMGSEIGMYAEWKDQEQVDWFLLKYPIHIGLHDYIKDMNKIYLREKSLYEADYDPNGFEWIDVNNYEQQVISYIRKSKNNESLIVVLNFSDQVYYDFNLGVNDPGKYRVVMNSDLKQYGGSHQTISGYLFTQQGLIHGRTQFLSVKVPPYGMLILKKVKEKIKDKG